MKMKSKIKYVAEAPNFKFSIIDYINVIKSMKRLSSKNIVKYKDERDLLEEKFRKYLNVKNAISVTNAASGIDIALEVIGINEKSEIVSCALNFYGTHLSVLKYGAKLILCENKKNSIQMDENDMEKKITKNTDAVIVTQMNGFSADMDKIKSIINKKEEKYHKKIYIIEDAARSLGAEYKGRKVGTIGDIGIYSFQTKKNFSTLGEGGLIVTDNDIIADKIIKLRSFGKKLEYGTNYRLSRVQCAAGIGQINKLDSRNLKRIKIAEDRNKLLQNYKNLLYIEKEYKDRTNVYTYYNIYLNEKFDVNDRNKIRNILLSKYGIETCIANEPTYITHKYIRENVESNTPLAKNTGERMISLPINFRMKFKDNKYIVKALIDSINSV